MRKIVCVLAMALASAIVSLGCQPKILIFNAQPSSAPVGPTKVTLNWKISAGSGHLSADQPVTPTLDPPLKVNQQGSKTFDICKTTTFKLELPYGGEKTVTVKVTTPCDAAPTCSNQTLNFTGTCLNAQSGPTYDTHTLAANLAPGNLKNLFNNADFPVHVLHAGQDIALGAGGGPIFPLPVVPAAGDYQVYIPGATGQQICQDATGPVGGGQADAPPVQIVVVPTCPTP